MAIQESRVRPACLRIGLRRLLMGAAVAGLLAVPVTAFAQWGPGGGVWPMGPGMMGGGFQDQPVAPGWGGRVMSYADAEAFIAYGNSHGTADAKANSVTFDASQVTIDLIADQPGSPDQTFELHGLVNPTIVVPHGAAVQLNLINMDYGRTMEHTAEIVAVPPPYPYMAMMSMGRPVVQPLPEVPWRSREDAKAAEYGGLGVSFIADLPGSYWYVCPTPGHAAQGMYGRLIVR